MVDVLFIGGAHNPAILSNELEGNVKEPPEHNAVTCVNVGVTFGFTVTVIVVVVPHWLIFGVNVYKVVAVLFIGGAHVPEILLMDVPSNVIVPPEQIGLICVKLGKIGVLTIIVPVEVTIPHPFVNSIV